MIRLHDRPYHKVVVADAPVAPLLVRLLRRVVLLPHAQPDAREALLARHGLQPPGERAAEPLAVRARVHVDALQLDLVGDGGEAGLAGAAREDGEADDFVAAVGRDDGVLGRVFQVGGDGGGGVVLVQVCSELVRRHRVAEGDGEDVGAELRDGGGVGGAGGADVRCFWRVGRGLGGHRHCLRGGGEGAAAGCGLAGLAAWRREVAGHAGGSGVGKQIAVRETRRLSLIQRRRER